MPAAHTGGALVAEAIATAGVEVVFTLPGRHIGPVLGALESRGARVVRTRHEENAVFMAAGMALSTAQVGVACVTAGPGLANAVPGITEAQAAGIPVVLIAGRTALAQRGRGAVQDLDQLTLVSSITKWRASCFETWRIPEYVAAAIHHARAGSPGVAYLEIPEDVLSAEVEEPLQAEAGFAPPARTASDPDAIERAVDILGAAERPVALAGSGAFFARAGAGIERFTSTTGIPVVTTSAARGLLSDDHQNCAGSLVHGGAAMLSADVSLLLGSRFNANLLYGRAPLFAPESKVIQVDISSENTGGQRRPELALTGDVSVTLDAITEAWNRPPDSFNSWRADAIGAAEFSRAQWSEEADREANGVHPGWLARESARFASEHDAPFVVDGGDSVIWGLAFGKATHPGRHLFLGSAMGTLGVGLPYAIATSSAHETAAVLFTGDGSFGLSAMEVDTAARQGSGVLTVVVNNGGWGGPGPGFRYQLLAEAAGGTGIRAEDEDAVHEALADAWEDVQEGRPAVVDVITDPSVHSDFMAGMGSLALM